MKFKLETITLGQLVMERQLFFVFEASEGAL